MAYHSVYYQTARGEDLIRKLLDKQNFKVRQKFFAWESQLLQVFGTNTPTPHVKPLGDKIYSELLARARRTDFSSFTRGR